MLKALEKDRERRYQSAADVAQDIRRYLKGEPIEARPATVWTRAVRWIVQHPVAATTSTCLAIAAMTIAASLVVVWFVNSRPHRIDLLKNEQGQGYEARLVSMGGRILHSWKAGRDGMIAFAELVERPAEFGSGRLAVLGFHRARPNAYPNSVCAYDVGGSCDAPIWHGRIELDDIPEPLLSLGRGHELSHISKGNQSRNSCLVLYYIVVPLPPTVSPCP